MDLEVEKGMIGINSDCPPGAALLAEHLDAALAAGEDLLASSLPARADLDEADPQSAPDALDGFVRKLLQLEGSLVLRLLQARRLASEIGRADSSLKSVAALFRAQTDLLHEMIAGAGRSAEGALVRAGDSHAYIRSRGLIAPEAAAPSPYESLSVDESFRVGGVVQLSEVMNLVAAVLDLIDARFGLYTPDFPEEDHGASARHDATDAGGTVSDPVSLASALDLVRTAGASGDDAAGGSEATSGSEARPRDDGQPAGSGQPAGEEATDPKTADPASVADADEKGGTRSYRPLTSLIAEIERTSDRF